MEPIELQDDLRAEVALILCEHSDEKIISIHESSPNALRYYTVRIILNLIQSKTSPFYKKYRHPIFQYNESFSEENEFAIKDIAKYSTQDNLTEEEQFNIRLQAELKEEKVLKIIDGLYWYDREIVKLYIEKGDYRAIAKEVGIPWGSIYDTVQMALNKIKYELRTGVSWEVASKIKTSQCT
jgi:DNA-directed RNA polymerase specialized sigma24 family protein